jgi:hypothetical protein
MTKIETRRSVISDSGSLTFQKNKAQNWWLISNHQKMKWTMYVTVLLWCDTLFPHSIEPLWTYSKDLQKNKWKLIEAASWHSIQIAWPAVDKFAGKRGLNEQQPKTVYGDYDSLCASIALRSPHLRMLTSKEDFDALLLVNRAVTPHNICFPP